MRNFISGCLLGSIIGSGYVKSSIILKTSPKKEKWVLEPGHYYHTFCDGIYRWHDQNEMPTKFIYKTHINGSTNIQHIISLDPQTILDKVTISCKK